MKKVLAIVLALTLVAALLVFAGCSGKDGDTTTDASATAANADTSGSADKVIRVGASATPHAEILETVKEALKAEGYELDIVIYNDYVLPNTALADGEIDANYFQHAPYLNNFNASNKTDLVSAASIHYEPLAVYGNGVTDLKSLESGADIIIPTDDSNQTRALFLLQQEGLITLPDDANAEKGVTTLDIVNNGGYNIIPVQADSIAAQLKNSDAGSIAVINGNYALSAGLKIADALASEDAAGAAAQTYSNIIAVRAADVNSAKTVALINALKTDAVKEFIANEYNGSVVAIF